MTDLDWRRPSPSVTFVAVGLSAALAAGQPTWPRLEAATYVTAHAEPTYGFFQRSFPLGAAIHSQDNDFASEIASVYAELAVGQEPLGAEFEAAWDKSIDKLYES